MRMGWHVLWVTSVLVAFELVAPRGRVPLASRLRGAVIWLITIPAAASCTAMFHYFWWKSDLSPLVRLPLGDWFRSAGAVGIVVGAVAAPVISGAIADFFGYWYHRAQHAVPFLWRMHAVHHSISDLSAINSNHHWTEEVFRVPLMTFPAALLIGPETGPQLPIVAAVLAVQGAFIHAATRLHLGPLRWFFVDNRYHRLHHSRSPEHFGKNYAAFTTLWDRLFGTAYDPMPGDWPETGLTSMPEPASVAEFIIAPLRPRAF